MNKKQYIIPSIYVKRLQIESLLTSLSGGGKDKGNGEAEIKSQNHIWDDDSDDYFL